MKVKVYQYGTYPRNNQIVVHCIDIEQLFDNVYYYLIEKSITAPENDKLGIILHIKGNYFDFGHCFRREMNVQANIEYTKTITNDYVAFLNSKMQNNQHISLMDMKIYEKLCINTTPLIEYCKHREATLNAEKEARKQKEEQKKQSKIEQEKQRLIEVKQNYIKGSEISGEDFVSICREDGLTIHTRTVGFLYKSVSSLKKNGNMHIWKQKGKPMPKTDGVRKLIKKYNSFIDNKDK